VGLVLQSRLKDRADECGNAPRCLRGCDEICLVGNTSAAKKSAPEEKNKTTPVFPFRGYLEKPRKSLLRVYLLLHGQERDSMGFMRPSVAYFVNNTERYFTQTLAALTLGLFKGGSADGSLKLAYRAPAGVGSGLSRAKLHVI
jgi:hypothetical protein